MITLDIFNNDAFSVISMLEPVNKMPTEPGFLGSLGIFDVESVSTDTVGVTMKNGRLDLIPTTLRGAPIEMAAPRDKNIRDFRIPRLAKGDQIFAHQLANLVADVGGEVETVARVLAEKQQNLKQDLEYTREFHRLGALQGILLDADGTTEIYDYYDEWGISQPAEIDMNLPTAADGDLRESMVDIKRQLVRAAGGVGVRRVIGLAGDNYWDELIKNPEVRATYLGWSAASELRGNDSGPFETFRYGGIDWINYQGSDDNDTIAIDVDDALIFPVARGLFSQVNGPGETFETINRPGRDVYPLVVRDLQRNQWVQPEIYAYPLYLNRRPDLILRATVGA